MSAGIFGTSCPAAVNALQITVDATQASSDEELIERALRGEREAFALLYGRHQAPVYRFARAMTGSSSLAEDVVQDVFLTLMRDLGRYDVARGALRTYLFGIARNIARHKARTVRRLLSLTEIDDWAGIDDPAEAFAVAQETLQLRRCLSALPSRYREVIVLCDLQELDYAETATVLGVPVGTVRSRLHRGRQMLLERLRQRAGLRSLTPAAKRCVI